LPALQEPLVLNVECSTLVENFVAVTMRRGLESLLRSGNVYRAE
jgi:hypothetical protein